MAKLTPLAQGFPPADWSKTDTCEASSGSALAGPSMQMGWGWGWGSRSAQQMGPFDTFSFWQILKYHLLIASFSAFVHFI